ncbi:MAG: DNA polymerase IV [Halobacteriales archaeon]
MRDHSSALPGVEATTDEEAIVCHVDMDCFYAACERLREPGLEGEAVVVGMGYEPGDDGGVVATASYEAREHGLRSAQPISDALARLPRATVMPTDYVGPVAHYRPVDMAYYRSVSREVLDVLETFADAMRVASLDEAYLDVTDRTTWAEAEAFGVELKATVAEAVGVTASVGIGPTRGVAKIASDHDKPDGLTVVPPPAVEAFLADLPVEDLHGVGPITAEALRDLDLERIGDVAGVDPAVLEAHFGERGRDLAARARGAGPSEVTPQGLPKSLSRESSLGGGTDDADEVRERVGELAREVAARANRKGASYRTVGIKVVTPPFDVNTRERSFGGPFSDATLVERTALELLEEFEGEMVRKVGVRVAKLDFAPEQASLGDYGGSGAAVEVTTPPRRTQRRLSDFERPDGAD